MAKISTRKKIKDNNLVPISNQLIESFVKKGNVVAFKILFYLAKCEIEIGSDVMLIKINTKQLCDFCNIDIKTLHRNIEQLTETSISIKDEKSTSYITVLPYAKFNYSGTLEIKIFKEILELIQASRNQFTVIDASSVVKLSSKHSIKMIMLLEYISNFSDQIAKRKYYDLDELNLMFGTKYVRMGQFDKAILEPVKIELDGNSKLSFEYEIFYDKLENTVGRAKALGVYLMPITSNHYQGKLL